jgi:hypothetical protein
MHGSWPRNNPIHLHSCPSHTPFFPKWFRRVPSVTDILPRHPPPTSPAPAEKGRQLTLPFVAGHLLGSQSREPHSQGEVRGRKKEESSKDRPTTEENDGLFTSTGRCVKYSIGETFGAGKRSRDLRHTTKSYPHGVQSKVSRRFLAPPMGPWFLDCPGLHSTRNPMGDSRGGGRSIWRVFKCLRPPFTAVQALFTLLHRSIKSAPQCSWQRHW